MIFVTVGTHEQPFDRLVKAIDDLAAAGILTEEVIIQTGYSTYTPRHCTWQPFFPSEEMTRLVREARIVITHGGPASFLLPIRYGKVPVVMPRIRSFGEHVNDHQLTFCREVAARNRNILLAEDARTLEAILADYDALAAQCPVEAVSNNAAFNRGIQSLAEALLQ